MHSWSDTGTFEVRALARDQKQLTSDLSGGLMVRVGLRRPPNTPAEPTGTHIGGQDSSYTFTTAATHPDGITVATRFAWGDGDTSGWSPFVASGESVRMSHTWSKPDTYAVRAQAKDTGNALSLWSLPCSVIIRPPDTLRKWRFYVGPGDGNTPSSSPAIGSDGTIYVGSLDDTLYAINSDGTLKWRYGTAGKVRSSPAIASDGTIYVGSDDSCLYAVNSDGTLGWKFRTYGRISSSPAIAADGAVCFGTWNGDIYALNSGGTPKWSYLTGSRMSASPAIAADGTVYIGSEGGEMYALNADGTYKWRYGTNGLFQSAPAIAADGTVYVGAEGDPLHNFLALNPDSTLKWGYVAGLHVRSAPAVASDGTVYFGSSTPDYVYAFNPDGTQKWKYQTGGGVYAGPAIASDGTIYVGADDHCLYALKPDGTLKWRYETDGNIESSPTIGSDGTVYFTSDDGYLYALKGTSPLADSPWPKFHHDLRNTGRTYKGSGNPLRLSGPPETAIGDASFLIHIVNTQTYDVTIDWLQFVSITPDSAYMRNFLVNGNEGGPIFPIPNGQNGLGVGDTVFFTPVTVPASMSQQVDLMFEDFRVGPADTSQPAKLVGKTFQLLFSDGSEVKFTVPIPIP
jgi:outer membrane protein assembly factor BamB